MSSGRRSPPQEAGNHPRAILEPFYTNEDVAFLHDIVSLAQELLHNLPEGQRLPTTALFDAYYEILPRVGLNADHDNRYARVLFKIGGVRGAGTLYEKFEGVLSKMGIDIEFEVEEEQNSNDQHEIMHPALEDTEASIISQDENIPPRGRPRRNSDSAWELVPDFQAKSQQRRNSYSSSKKPKVPPIPDRHGILREVLQQQPSNQLPRESRDSPRSNAGAWLNAEPVPQLIHRGRSLSTQAEMRIRRRSLSIATGRHLSTTIPSKANSEEYPSESDITAVTSAHEPDTTNSIDFSQRHISNKPPVNVMQNNAEVILQHHLSFLAKRQLRTWRDRALQRQEDYVNLELIAFQHDKDALLLQALDIWHKRHLVKRSIAETERFFSHLERRSVRARDLYILHRSLTHWHECACEEAERTRAARRHVLRTRMFNAWRDITAVNELKVRRQVLKKFFRAWQRKHTVIRINFTIALRKDEGNLVRDICNVWVQKIWDINANKRWAAGLKKRTLLLWKLATRKTLESYNAAEEERYLHLAWNSWRIWKSKTTEHINQDQQATTFRRIYLCIAVIRKWRGETKVVPAKKTLQAEVARRILQVSFAIWLRRSREERQAAAIDRLHILREAWTKWRHKSRLRIMRARVDNRVIWDSIYRLMIARRVSTTEISSKYMLLRKTLKHWANRAQGSKCRRWDQENIAREVLNRRAQQTVVRHWETRLQEQQQLEGHAQEISLTKLLAGAFLKWSEVQPHLHQLQQWSREADFYFLTSKSLRRWKASTDASKRGKRKAAYTQVRRSTKMNLVRGILLGWRTKAEGILDMQAQAQDVRLNRSIVVGMNIFDRWRARREELEELKSTWLEGFLRKYFETWKERSTAFQELKVGAVLGFQEGIQSRTIKKWELVILQVRGRSIQAAEVQEKNAKRHFRRVFKYWHQKAAERRPFKSFEGSAGGRPASLEATAKAEAWSNFEDDGDLVRGLAHPFIATPLPGYLNTPSRRTERVVAAAAKFSSTTPRAPLSTPFERHLRAQYSGGVPSLRGALRGSILRVGGEFPDITVRSVNDDQNAPS